MKKILSQAPESRDIAIGALLFMVVILMILPMPTPLVDALIGLNFGIAFLLLMTAVYLSTPLALSSLPGIILISTVFRLALSISTTRLILAEGDAGRIVETFGSFVVAGNIVVGLVVFFIITIVQFIVIAKGAERIAEVSARFTLDALPGKQMSIDAELRNGDIDNVEAGQKRLLLERESQFFGAMDGALKFVKGDAIAGLIIILINLVGGLTIGVMQFGMSMSEAGRKYTLLTVGDALISQIPALLMAITAAVIVTRVKGERTQNLGADIFTQIAADRRAVYLAAVALSVMAIIPGFPTVILLSLAAVFAAVGFLLPMLIRDPDGSKEAPADGDTAEEAADDKPEMTDIPKIEDARAVIEVSTNLMTLTDDWAEKIAGVGRGLQQQTGLEPCVFTVAALDSLEPGEFRLSIEDVPYLWSTVDPDALYTKAIPDILDMHDISYLRPAQEYRPPRLKVAETSRAQLEAASIPYVTPVDVICEQAREALARNFSQFVGVQETKEILAELEEDYAFLVGECARNLPLPKVAEIFRRLLDERVPLHNKRKILETIVEWSATDTNPLALTEYCRLALNQQICAAHADRNRVITTLVVERDTEDELRANVRETGIGTFLVLPIKTAERLLKEIRDKMSIMSPKGIEIVVMTSMDVRRHLKTFLTRAAIDIDVMSFQELSDDYTAVPCATLRLRGDKTARDKDDAADGDAALVSDGAEMKIAENPS